MCYNYCSQEFMCNRINLRNDVYGGKNSMKKISYKYAFATLLFAFFMISQISTEAQAVNIPTNTDFGGMINSHDMMMFREKQRWQEENIDVNNLKKRENDIKEEVINKETEYTTSQSQTTLEKVYDKNSDKRIKKQIEEQKKQKNNSRLFKKKSKLETNTTEEITEEPTENNNITESFVDGKVYIKAVRVSYSRILTDEEIQNFVNPIIDKYITFNDLSEVVDNINYHYASNGYVTAKAYIPPQTLEDGTVTISLIEGKVGQLNVSNNKYTSSSYIKKRLSAKEDEVFEIAELENDIVKFNHYNQGIRLNANLKKGKEEGTTDIDIVAQEKFPFHVVGLMDNAGRKTIGELRGGLMIYADSLFKQRDKLTIGSYASSHSITPFADYNIPVNKQDGRVGFTFSTSYSEIANGPYEIFDISSRSYNYSLYYTHPLIRTPKFELNSYTAANYKEGSTLFGDYRLHTDQVTSLETALNARYDTKRGIWYATQGVYQAFPLFDDNSKYFKYTGSLMRLHDFGHGIVGQFRGMYQFSPSDNMPYIDQFQAGGIATVRGYSEGLLIGRSGYILSAEMMFPILPQTITIKKNEEKKKIPFLGNYIKGIAFVDHSGVYPFKGEGPDSRSYTKDDYMVSTGVGLKINLPGDASARLYWGYPLMHNNNEKYVRKPRFSFELSFAPDFDKILSWKRNKQEKENL